MAPKKGKKKKSDNQEPSHSPEWEDAISNKKWDKSPDLLPDSSRWPTWGALRERILATCQEIAVNDSQACDDTFAAEVVKLSPPELERLDLQRNAQLKTFILAPEGSCPSLRYLNLSGCTSLEYLYVQSESLEEVHLSNCESLKKAVVHAPSMSNVNVDGCSNLGTLLLWTDELESLDLSNCPSLRKRQLYCPKLSSLTPPSSHQVEEKRQPQRREPISFLLKRWHEGAVESHQEERRAHRVLSTDNSTLPVMARGDA